MNILGNVTKNYSNPTSSDKEKIAQVSQQKRIDKSNKTDNSKPTQELIKQNLNQEIPQSNHLVNHQWKLDESTKDASNELSLMKEFVTFLGKNLEESYACQSQKLFQVVNEDVKTLNPVSLIGAKSPAHILKEKVVIILKDLNEKDLDNLEILLKDRSDFENLKHIFDLTKIYRQIEESSHLRITSQIESAFRNIIEASNQKDGMNNIRQVIGMISDLKIQEAICRDTVKVLVQNDKLKEAIETATLIPLSERTPSLSYIFKAFMQKDDLAEALKIAEMANKKIREQWFGNIAVAFARIEINPDSALKVAEKISDPTMKKHTFQNICKEFAQKGEFDLALSIIVQKIEDKHAKEYAAKDIANALFKKGGIQEVQEFAKKTTYSLIKSCLLTFVNKKLNEPS